MDAFFDFWQQRDMQVDVLEDCGPLMGECPLLRTHPSVDLLLDHLEEALSIHRVDVHFGLQPTVFVRPGEGLAHHAVRAEFS